jgi:hypothetical protein
MSKWSRRLRFLTYFASKASGNPDADSPTPAQIALARLGGGGSVKADPVVSVRPASPATELQAAMMAVERRQSRAEADAALLLAVLQSPLGVVVRPMAVRMHEELLATSGLTEVDRRILQRLHRASYGRDFVWKAP